MQGSFFLCNPFYLIFHNFFPRSPIMFYLFGIARYMFNLHFRNLPHVITTSGDHFKPSLSNTGEKNYLLLRKNSGEKIGWNSCFEGLFFVSEGLKWSAEVVETCGKFLKCELNIYLPIPKRYNMIELVETKLWKIK